MNSQRPRNKITEVILFGCFLAVSWLVAYGLTFWLVRFVRSTTWFDTLMRIL